MSISLTTDDNSAPNKNSRLVCRDEFGACSVASAVTGLFSESTFQHMRYTGQMLCQRRRR